MKSKLFLACLAVALGWSVPSQGQVIYENPGFVNAPPDIPPNIDANTFINDGQFIINFTNQIWFLPPLQAPYPFETQNTDNFTNSFGAFMACNTGFLFDKYDSVSARHGLSKTFFNEGIIHCGTVDTLSTLNFEGFFGLTNLVIVGTAAGSQMRVQADTIVNSGEIDMGFQSVCSLSGNHLALDHTAILMETNGFSASNFGFLFNGLIFDGYWGLTNYPPNPPPTITFSPATWFESQPAITPPQLITNRNYQVDPIQQLGGPTYQTYLSDVTDFTTSNRWVRAVFLNNTNSGLQANVYFPIGATVVEFTNTAGTSPGNLYLFDTFLYQTNFQLLLNGFSGTRPTFIPENYSLFVFPGSFFFFGSAASPISAIPFGTFNSDSSTNQYSSYEALFLPISSVLGDTFNQTYANTPGRIELSATNFLSLNQAQLSASDFLHVAATNQFGGSAGARISSPYSEFNLRSTNGSLTISNLTVPTLNRNEGTCDLYSARWTNIVGSITNNYHVLFVNANLAPISPTRLVGLTLRSTNTLGGQDNLVISDVLNCLSNNVLLDCSALTIATNQPGSDPVTGGLNFMSPNIVWSGITPRLQYLTNRGSINAVNTMFFRGSRSSPYYTSNYNEPYISFVNRGGVTNYGSRIYSTDFQNTGVFSANGGSIELHQAATALMTNGAFLATGAAGGISIESGTLYISNHVLAGTAALTLNNTNWVDDGSVSHSLYTMTNKNFWACSGLNLVASSGSLLGTTIVDSNPSSGIIRNSGANKDLGCSPAGYTNNAALGHLILNGQGLNSLFSFVGVSSNNALYVDELEFRGSVATNVDASKNYSGVLIDPGFKIYYAQAMANGISIAERLNGKNGGGFCWVSNYNVGFFSSTNLVYPDGSTNRLNAALVASCDIDSNGNGVPNCIDPAPIPILSPAGLGLAVNVSKQSNPVALVSWNVFPGTINTLLSAPTFNANDWQVVTNIYYPGPFPGRITIPDVLKANGPQFYRVRVSAY